MQIKPEQLAKHLEKELKPVYLVAGDEPLQTGEAGDLIRKIAREKGFTERVLFTSEPDIDWNSIHHEAQSMSLFGDQRLIEIRLGEKRPTTSDSKLLTPLLESPPADVLFLVTTSKLQKKRDHNSAWVKAAGKSGVLVETWPIGTTQLPRWIQQRLAQHDLEATPDAIALLAERSEGNLLACRQEIEKLALLCDQGKVGPEDIQRAVGDTSRYTPFDLSDAMLSGDATRSLRILDHLRDEDAPLPLILWSITRDLRDMAALANGSKPYIAPQRQNHINQRVRHLGLPGIHKALTLAAQADQSFKGMERGNSWNMLTSLILRVCGKPLPPALNRF